MKFLLIPFFVLFSVVLHAQPTRLVESVLFELNLKIENCYENLIVVAPLPGSAKESIVIIPEIVEMEEDYMLLNSYVLIVNNASAKIRHKYFEANAWTSDAVQLDEISVDTAVYILNDKTTAFGVKLHFNGSSGIYPFESQTLSLFVPHGDALDIVLKNFEARSFNGELSNTCAGEFTDIHNMLSLSTNKTNGYFDILVNIETAKIKRDKNCDDKTVSTITKSVLKFANGMYAE